MAIEFRQTFHRDIVIDMWCYRRFGHNEGDEPSFTQPLMYAKSRKHALVSEGYAARLKAENLIDDGFVAGITHEFTQHLAAELEAAKRYQPNQGESGRAAGRESVCQYVEMQVASVQKKKKI